MLLVLGFHPPPGSWLDWEPSSRCVDTLHHTVWGGPLVCAEPASGRDKRDRLPSPRPMNSLFPVESPVRTEGPFHPFESLRQKSKDREFLLLGRKALSPGKSWTHCCADANQEPQKQLRRPPRQRRAGGSRTAEGELGEKQGPLGSGPGQVEKPQPARKVLSRQPPYNDGNLG